MKIKNWNIEDRVLIIAEIGNNHEGNYSLAEKMINKAYEAGVDAVKFQTFKTEHYVSKKDIARYNMLKSFELSYDEFERLSNYAKELGLIFISTPFDIESVDFLNKIVDAYKISSGDNNFYPLIQKIAENKKPIILSTGFADIAQIKKSVDLIESIWNKDYKYDMLSILHCVSAYPVESKYANLKAIQTIGESFKYPIGYSDHTIGIEAALASVALGAKIIEKHFTIDKNYSDFRDHQLSADPEEMKSMVEGIRKVEEMFGNGKKILQQPEMDSLQHVRRSIVVNKEIEKNHRISHSDLTWIRLSGGMSPGFENLLIGKKTIKEIDAFEIITEDDVN